MATYTFDKIEYGSNIYKVNDSGALQLTGGQVTGPVTFGDSVNIDEVIVGDLLVNGSSNFTNGVKASSYNGGHPTYFVKGTQTASTNVWTGNLPSEVTSYYNGLTVDYLLPYAGTSTAATLNLSGLGAKPVYVGNTATSGVTTHYPANVVMHLTYVIDSSFNSGNGCWKVTTYQNSTYYVTSAYCGTAAATAAKAASVSYYTLQTGYFHIMMIYTNTAASALTLNVNSKGAKPIYINGVASSSSNYTLPQGLYIVYYNGTNYYFRTDGKLDGQFVGSLTGTASGNLTSSSSLDATKLTGTIPASCYTNTNTTYTLSNALSSHKFTETLTAGGSGSGTSTATMTLAAGTGITLTDDTTNKKITIACSVTNTDSKVTQTVSDSNGDTYEVLFSGTADNTTRTEGARKSSNLVFTPSEGMLQLPWVVVGDGQDSYMEMMYDYIGMYKDEYSILLNTSSGIDLIGPAGSNSPALVFKRGELNDNYNDWQIQDRSGYLYFDERGLNSTSWTNRVLFDTSGRVTAAIFNGSGSELTGVVPTSRTVNSKALSSNITLNAADVGAVPDCTIGLYNGNAGNPNPIRFLDVNYTNANSENGVLIKVTMRCGHGNGISYNFLQDVFISVSYTGTVSVDIYRYYAQSITYESTTHYYGDIFYTIDTTNKIVTFYTLMGQYSTVYSSSFRRMNSSSGGAITQYTSATKYSSGTKTYGTVRWLNGGTILYGTDTPASSLGSNGDIYVKYS